jgi:putative membrane protein insertion efficiency factor
MRDAVALVVRLPRLALVALIRVYQLVVSPWTAPSCKFYPSCSAYAATALIRHGVLRGGWLAVTRVCRCHPWTDGGVDHVPPTRQATALASAAHTETTAGADARPAGSVTLQPTITTGA